LEDYEKYLKQFYVNYSTIDNIFVDSLFEINLNSMKQSFKKNFFIILFGFFLIVLINSYLKHDYRLKPTKFLNSNFNNQNEISIIENEKGKYS
jgi:hypothetical protein